jgi:CrcB protein
MELKNIIWVGLGGMLGAVARYFFGLLIKSVTFPYATGIVNIVGALMMGLIMGLSIKGQISPNLRLFLATGICGGFTTFSAFAWENLELLQQQRYGSFLAYTFGTLALGLAATAIGYLLAK